EEKARRFEQIIEESGGETSSCRSKLREARRELMDLLDTEEPDEKAVLKKVEEISGLQGELEKLLVQRLLRSRSILDHEESKRFLRLIRRRMGHGSRRHHPRRNPVERKGII
ncbi:MAG: periplasmic heavy metal sensor, partial [Candidatus Krumholzibacteria bacterium]|nr:periplasmic heavy metal sensor [Candidatus Krumholzibacteria bacterium]